MHDNTVTYTALPPQHRTQITAPPADTALPVQINNHTSMLLAFAVAQGSVPRQQPPANDLFIPQHMPFDLTASQQLSSYSHSASHQLQQSSQADHQVSSSQTAASTLGWQEPFQARRESDAGATAAFRLLPSAVFEQLSDPNRLNGSPASSPALEEVSAGTVHERLAGQNNEPGVNAQLEKMQQKPVWDPTDSGNSLSC